nr:MAG TPA: hypothetical protein [Bacteriophage sp.]
MMTLAINQQPDQQTRHHRHSKIQRYSAWVCSRAMKNIQPAIAL